jgi:hypothetical protein
MNSAVFVLRKGTSPVITNIRLVDGSTAAIRAVRSEMTVSQSHVGRLHTVLIVHIILLRTSLASTHEIIISDLHSDTPTYSSSIPVKGSGKKHMPKVVDLPDLTIDPFASPKSNLVFLIFTTVFVVDPNKKSLRIFETKKFELSRMQCRYGTENFQCRLVVGITIKIIVQMDD